MHRGMDRHRVSRDRVCVSLEQKTEIGHTRFINRTLQMQESVSISAAVISQRNKGTIALIRQSTAESQQSAAGRRGDRDARPDFGRAHHLPAGMLRGATKSASSLGFGIDPRVAATLAGSHVQHRHAFGRLVSVPAALRDDHEIAGAQRSDQLFAVLAN